MDLAEGLLEEPGRYELIVSWSPGQDHELRFILLVVNNRVLVHDRGHDNAPIVFRRLPPPNAAGKFQVSWALSPHASMDAIAIGWEDLQTPNSRRVIAKTGASEPGKLWHGSVTVDPKEMPDAS